MRKRFLGIFIIFSLAFAQISSASAFSGEQIIRAGLYYGSSAMATANLQNYVGSGYKFGYYNDQKTFIAVGSTSETRITMMKDSNIYLSSSGTYSDTAISSSAGVVGGYHLQSSKTFYTFSDAKKYADTIQSAKAFPCYISGVFRVRIGSYTSESTASSAKSSLSSALRDALTVVSPSGTCYTVTTTGTATILFEFDQGGQAFAVNPVSSSGRAVTWFKSYKYYGGFCYNRVSGGNLSVINYVFIDDYVKGVIPYEMSASWPVEALKAQAVCARSYAYNNLNKHKSYGFDLCNSTDCQVYKGTNSANSNSDNAVDATSGQYMTYGEEIATGFYHSSDGGATESSENVWSSAVGYLRGVKDPYENASDIPNYNWSFTLTNAQVASILKSKNYSLSGVSNLYIEKFTDMGNVYRLTVVTTDGQEIHLDKSAARSVLTSSSAGVTIRSMRFKVSGGSNGTSAGPGAFYINSSPIASSKGLYAIGVSGTKAMADLNGSYAITSSGIEQMKRDSSAGSASSSSAVSAGTYTFTGTGWGHNVGMSQYGAKGMAEQGYDYQSILKFYYTGISIRSANG